MKLLGIDTSTEIASVALLHGEELLYEEQNNQRTHAQFVLPMVDKLMSQGGLQMNQLDAIVFGRGPGSFTGLRIACSIAKGLAYAYDLGVIPVSSLLAIAWCARKQQRTHVPILTVLDARMHELYWAYFAKDQWESEERVSPVHELCLPEKNSVLLAGVGIDLYQEGFTEDINAQLTDKVTVYPSAVAMIEVAQFLGLKPISVAQAQPVYVRNKVT